MTIIYVSCFCSKNKYHEIFECGSAKPGQQVQKFHRLLSSGLAQLENVKVLTVSGLPISRNISKKIIWEKAYDKENDIDFLYVPFLNLPVLRQICLFVSSFFYISKYIRRHSPECRVLCDGLNLSVSAAALLAAKLYKIKNTAIVTDLPNFLHFGSHKASAVTRLIRKINTLILKSFDSYLLMTEAMSDLINPDIKPFVIVEGMVDSQMRYKTIEKEEKFKEKVILYAGALYERFGVKKLLEAFMKLEGENLRLCLYGNGELEDYIRECAQSDKRIEFYGVVENDVVVEQEMKATLLINPRPSGEEFTKYSFPSKNMEYMVSGTPVLCTALPGMPEEYYDYVYIFEDESVDGFTAQIKELLKRDSRELQMRGDHAKEFVLNYKNNIIQAKKVINIFNVDFKKNF